jgi:hypothetical protein
MNNAALFALTFAIATSWPLLAAARQVHHYGHHTRHHGGAAETHSPITCETVRSYVAQVGVAQARAMALGAGMTASEERRARRCLVNRS